LIQLQECAQEVIVSGRFSRLFELMASKGPKYKLFYLDFETNDFDGEYVLATVHAGMGTQLV
jgi:hypothetical protein